MGAGVTSPSVYHHFFDSMLPLILKMEEEECEERSEAEKIIECETIELLNRIKLGLE